MKVNMLKVRRSEKGNLPGPIRVITKVISMTALKEKEFTHGMINDNILVIGKQTKCTEKEFLLGQMDENSKGAILTIKSTVQDIFLGQMADHMRELGLMESKMVSENISMPYIVTGKQIGRAHV